VSRTDCASQDISTLDVTYVEHAEGPLQASVYLPSGPGPFPLLVEVHGGAWCRGTRLDEDGLNRKLAQRGIAVAAIDFRMPPQAGYPASQADIHLALRWAKTQAAAWRCDAQRVGVMGLSSGAHQAMLAAMRPDDARYAALPLVGGAGAAGVDARVAFAVLCWPVIDPLGRYQYAREWKDSGRPYPEVIERVIPDHLKYWGDEAAMAEGNPVRALERGETVCMPPVLLLQGDQDLAHPRAHLERFVAAYQRAGGAVDLRWFAGEAEGFVNKKPDAPATAAAIDAIVSFVQRQAGADRASH
jgi:acetyl esterase